MSLEGKNYTLKCESQKKATKCLVKEGDRGGVKVLATIQCLVMFSYSMAVYIKVCKKYYKFVYKL